MFFSSLSRDAVSTLQMNRDALQILEQEPDSSSSTDSRGSSAPCSTTLSALWQWLRRG